MKQQSELVKKISKFLKKPKNQKVLIGIAIAATIIVFAGMALWRYLRPPDIYTIRPKEVNQEQLSQIIPPTATVQPENNQYLKGAQAILAHFDPTTRNSVDMRGFYGDDRRCSPTFSRDGKPVCEAVLVDFTTEYAPMASFRSTVQLIWARYQYYSATGDEQQLRQMLLDIDNIVVNVLDAPRYVLQNQDFNCLLMHELYFSPFLDDNTKAKVARICNESEPEMHPESLWEFDQHYHPAYFVEEFLNVSITDSSRVIDDSMRVTYTSAQLQEELNNYLVLLGNGGVVPSTAYANISDEDKLNYLRREASAAIDYLAAIDINENTADWYEKSLVDYLLVTKETLEWALTTPGAEFNDGTCLVSVSIQAYLNKFAPDLLTSAQLSTLASKFPVVGGASDLDCLIAAQLLLPELGAEVDRQLENRLGMLLASYQEGQPFGTMMALTGMVQEEEAYLYPTVRNSYLTGLLSRYGLTNNENQN